MAKKKVPVPADVLRQYMEEFHLNASQLADGVKLNVATVRAVLYGQIRISLSNACRLAKFFGTPVQFWIDTQLAYDIAELQNDQNLQNDLGEITKIKKGKAVESAKPPRKTRGPAKKTAAKNTTVAKPAKAATKSTAKPAAKSTAKAVVKPAAKSTAKPAAKAVTEKKPGWPSKKAAPKAKKAKLIKENDSQPQEVKNEKKSVILIKKPRPKPQVEQPTLPEQPANDTLPPIEDPITPNLNLDEASNSSN
jgi:addiction module HigA family antidote